MYAPYETLIVGIGRYEDGREVVLLSNNMYLNHVDAVKQYEKLTDTRVPRFVWCDGIWIEERK